MVLGGVLRAILIVFISATAVDAACTWPAEFANSEWIDSSKGTLTFADSTMIGWDFTAIISDTATTVESWECYSTELYDTDSFLTMKTTVMFQAYDAIYYGYLCLKLKPITTSSYRYYLYNPIQENINHERILIQTDSVTNVAMATVCAESVAATGTEYHVLIQSGSGDAVKVPCPYVFLGLYTYSHTTATGDVTCGDTTTRWDSCTDATEMAFNYPDCQTMVAYSESPTVWCVDNVPIGGDNFVTVYNPTDATVDNSNTYRFSCFGISGDGTTASVTPQHCKRNQSPGAVPVDNSGTPGTPIGATITMTTVEMCPSCQSLPDPEGGAVSYTTDGAVTTANYACAATYELFPKEYAVRECDWQGNVNWTLAEPACKCITPGAPTNGTVSVSFDGDVATYVCDAGFMLNGDEHRYCQPVTYTWNLTEPTCFSCDEVKTPTGGSVNITIAGGQSVALYSCDAGYTRIGGDRTTCQVDGSWSPTAPSCQTCVTLEHAASVSVTQTTDGAYTSATFSCVAGYYVTETVLITCDESLTWNGTVPECVCHPPDDLANGGVSSPDGRTATYSCMTGFFLVGSSVRSCNSDGTGWNGNAPTCGECQLLSKPTYGSKTVSTNGTVSITEFTCSLYTSMDDPAAAVLECQVDGTWIPDPPTCVKCPTLDDPPSGAVTVTTDSYTTTATYACAVDYNLVGENVTTCLNTGEWSSLTPYCECKEPSAPTNGLVYVDVNGEFAYYSCTEGFTMDGLSFRECLATGAGWSSTDPVCAECVELVMPMNGTVTVTSDGTTTKATYTCLVGSSLDSLSAVITCRTDGSWNTDQPQCVPCDELIEPSNGTLVMATDSTTTTAGITCHVGTTLNGDSYLTCTADGTWDIATPHCAVCPSRTDPTSGTVTLTSDGETTTAQYACAENYSIFGTSSTLTCRSDGNWNLPEPRCRCDDPTMIDNGEMLADGITATYTCNKNYTLSGAAIRTCQTDGTWWTGNDPSCALCETLLDTSAGTALMDTNGTVSSTTYTCPAGASLDGEPVIYCRSNGTWNAPVPSCVPCPNIIDPSSGATNVTTDGLVSVLKFICATGYYVSGPTSIDCQPSGEWTADPATCVCDPPDQPGNGTLDVSVDGLSGNYTCTVGYTLSGVAYRTCQSDGSGWTETDATCAGCPALESSGGSLITSGTETAATFTCGVGATMDGAAVITCQDTGAWSGQEPTCVSCDSLPVPNSSIVNTTSDGLTTTSTYACADGYVLEGEDTLACLTSGNWSSTRPTCFCIEPANPTNGTVTVSPDRTMATYECDVGYVMDGGSVRTCQTDGSGWSGTAPTCSKCASLPLLDGGNITLVTDGAVTTANLACDVGATITGDVILTCLTNGTWDVTLPDCVFCDPLPAPLSGSVNTSTDGATTTGTFQCATEYTLVGSHVLTCQPASTWDQQQPVCECNDPYVPGNGSVSLVTSGTSQTVQYQCAVGNTISGSVLRTCATDGSGWNGTDPTCVTCPSLDVVSDGNATLSTDGVVSSVEYTCDVGGTIIGDVTITCQSNGTWSSTQSTCVTCPPLTHPSSGTVNMTSNGSVSIATFTCAAGYHLRGDVTSTCQTDGTWSSVDQECVCDTPELPTNGSVSVSADGVTLTYECSLGYTISGSVTRTCQPDGSGWTHVDATCESCPALSDPENGQQTATTDGTTTQTAYNCSMGSTLVGSAVIECGPDGQWTSPIPSCATCRDLQGVSSGSLAVGTDGITTTAIYTCATEYYMDGAGTMVCQIDATWNSTEPVCRCLDPATPVNGNVSAVSTATEQTVKYECDVGNSISGSAVRTCATNGSGWIGTNPTCETCPDIDVLSGGNATVSTDGTVTSVEYTCDVGATIVGDVTISCQSNGTWSSTQSTCVTCPPLSDPSSGVASTTSNGSVSTTTYTCATGYELRGDVTRTCQTDGSWTGIPPECVCEAPPTPPGGNVSVSADGVTLTYECALGFTISGSVTRTCLPDGSGWTDVDATCESCPALSDPENGQQTPTTDGTTTQTAYNCSLGSTLVGSAVIECGSDGQWTSPIPYCATCRDLHDVSSDSLAVGTDGVTTTAVYTCAPEYYMEGAGTMVCQTDATWNGTEPACRCFDPSTPVNGNVSAVSTATEQTVKYECDVGNSISGSAVRTCATDGSGWIGTNPTCETCPDIDVLSGGNATVSTDGTVTSVEYTCDVGATIVGDVTISCQSDGTWSSTQSTCVTCPPLSDPSSGVASTTSTGSVSTTAYTCATGYELRGDVTRTCQTDGSWTGIPPECVCDAPPTPADGNVSVSADGVTLTYECTIGFTISGSVTRTCLPDGTGWTDVDATCASCPELSDPTNGVQTPSTNGTLTQVSYNCTAGSSLVGTAVIECGSDGKWSSTIPYCASCRDLEPVPSGRGSLAVTTDGVTSMATYTCTSGHYLEGAAAMVCQTDATWNATEPVCKCEEPPVPDFGTTTIEDEGETVKYRCGLGYTILGVWRRTCQSGGAGWTDSLPQCVPCDSLTVPEDGTRAMTTNGTVTKATFSCMSGTSMSGVSVMLCQDTGLWEAAASTCTPCDPLTAPASGTYEYSTDGELTSATLTCQTGWEVVGSTSITCGDDGAWTSATSSTYCSRIDPGTSDEGDSLLPVLIGVSVAAILIIAILSVILARYVYLYYKRLKYGAEFDNEKNEMDEANGGNNFPLISIAPAMPPRDHTQHMLFERSRTMSPHPAPAPVGHRQKQVKQDRTPGLTGLPVHTGDLELSRAPTETSITSSSSPRLPSSVTGLEFLRAPTETSITSSTLLPPVFQKKKLPAMEQHDNLMSKIASPHGISVRRNPFMIKTTPVQRSATPIDTLDPYDSDMTPTQGRQYPRKDLSPAPSPPRSVTPVRVQAAVAPYTSLPNASTVAPAVPRPLTPVNTLESGDDTEPKIDSPKQKQKPKRKRSKRRSTKRSKDTKQQPTRVSPYSSNIFNLKSVL